MLPKRFFFLLVCLLITLSSLRAQYVVDTPKSPYEEPARDTLEPSKWMFGGSFFISFGDIRSVMLTPRVGYWITNRFLMGGSYTYINWRQTGFNSINVHGPGVFSMYRIPNPLSNVVSADLLLNGEFEYLWVSSRESTRVVPQLFLGPSAFFRQGKGGVMVGILYNVLHNPNTAIFASPLQYRFGVFF